jgi:carbon-monoxide dehydrogenase small subunit
MLITARDIVTRLPGADRARVREELSGNLCRCTGYMGIVQAICSVLEDSRDGAAPIAEATPAAAPVAPVAGFVSAPESVAQSVGDLTALHHDFTVNHPLQSVWDALGEVEMVATCMPGVSLSEAATVDHVAGKIDIKIGPIGAAFAGEADIERDAANRRGVIRGHGRDTLSASRAKGEVTYILTAVDGGRATRVDLAVAFSLAGPLAQFSRGTLVNDLVLRLTAAFATNLEARLSGAGTAEVAAKLDAGSLLVSVVWTRIKAFFAALIGSR